MKQSLRWRLAGGALLAAVLLAVFFKGVDWGSLAQTFREARPAYLAAIVAVTLLTYLVRAWRWGYLLAPLARVPLGELFSATIVGFTSGMLIPRAGEVVRPYLVSRGREVRTSAAFASIILERLLDLFTVLLLFGLYLFVLPTPAQQVRGGVIDAVKAGGILVTAAACAVGLVLWASHRHADRVGSVIDRLLAPLPAGLSSALSRGLRSFISGLEVFKAPPRHLAAILAQSLIIWLTIAASIHCNNRAFGVQLPFHSAFLIIAFLTVGVAVPTPGMVGGFHEAYLLALTQVFGVDKGKAAAIGIAGHALTNLPVLVTGLYFLGRMGLTLGGVARITAQGGVA